MKSQTQDEFHANETQLWPDVAQICHANDVQTEEDMVNEKTTEKKSESCEVDNKKRKKEQKSMQGKKNCIDLTTPEIEKEIFVELSDLHSDTFHSPLQQLCNSEDEENMKMRMEAKRKGKQKVSDTIGVKKVQFETPLKGVCIMDEEEQEKRKREKEIEAQAKKQKGSAMEAVGKRQKGLALPLRSPFKRRCISILTPTTDQQNTVFDYLCATIPANTQIMYKNMLRSVTAYDFSSIEVEVHYTVMDAFTTVLNKNEEVRNPDHPNRMFLFVQYPDINYLEEDRDLEKNIEHALLQVSGRKLKDIDMIMVPIQQKEDYFVIVLNLKFKKIEIIDAVYKPRDMEYYIPIVQKMAKIVERQLKRAHLHKKAQFFEKAASKPVLLNLPAKSQHDEDYITGILSMRYMEMYMGIATEQWEDELTERNLAKCSKPMRVKYAHRIITSITNKVFEEAMAMIKESEESQQTTQEEE